MSCGVAEFHTDDNIEDVFDRADQAMYLAKQSGRNQCCSEEQLQEESA
jgi:diguanylate cyclase